MSAWRDVRMDAGAIVYGRAGAKKKGSTKHCEGQVVGGGELEGAGT